MILILGGAEAMATLGRGMVVMITLRRVAMATLGRGVVMLTRVAEAMVSPEDAVMDGESQMRRRAMVDTKNHRTDIEDHHI